MRRGNEKDADQAAVDAMRTELNKIDMIGKIVIGEGELDEAPMLYIGILFGEPTITSHIYYKNSLTFISW